MKIALTALIFALGFSFAPLASASEYGCKVALCLANPGSPTEHAACVPPIKKLHRDIARGKGFPSCDSAGGDGNSNTIANRYFSRYSNRFGGLFGLFGR